MSLEGKNIIMLSLFRYDAEIESTGMTVARHLADHNTVYYVDHPFTLNDALKQRNSVSFKRRKRYFSWFSDGVAETAVPNLKVVIPPLLLPINFLSEGWFYRRLLGVNEWLIRGRLRRLIKDRKLGEFVFINAFNFHYPGVADGLEAGVTMYYCLDPVAGSFDGRHGPYSERLIVKKSDLVVCSSKQLYREKLRLNAQTYFVPNAADVTHSGKALSKELAVSPKIDRLPKPVIGYFGNIEKRIDYELMKRVILMNPSLSFAFVGPRNSDVPTWFCELSNAYFPGSVPYEDMPSVIKGFDVALIPFRKDARSATVFPLKLFEYLGAGKPVVSTDFNPDLSEVTEGLVVYCSTAEDFSHAIRDALVSNTSASEASRIALAKKHTWESRVQVISELISMAWKEKVRPA